MTRRRLADETVRLKEARAVSLRAARMTYDQIAATVWPCPDHAGQRDDEWRDMAMAGCTECRPLYSDASAARKAIQRTLGREYELTAEARDTLLREDLSTTDAVIRRMMVDAQGCADPADRARAATALMRAMDHRAKLTGLYAPTRVTVTDELDQEIEQMLRALAEGTPHTAPVPADG